jgi:hemoglobin
MKTLYDELGAPTIQLLVTTFYQEVFRSSIINQLFQTDKEEIQRKQFLFLTQFLGGPNNYSTEFGHPKMRMRHLPHKIDETAKVEWLRCMKKAIDSLAITNDLKDRLYRVFPPIASHMVNH